MTTPYEIRQMLDILVHGDELRREITLIEFYRLDEEAVDPLCDEFYSGVDEATGIVILELVSEIGGPDAIRLLQYAQHFGDKKAWREAGERGLKRNDAAE